MSVRFGSSSVSRGILVVACVAIGVGATVWQTSTTMPGYAPATAAAQRQAEATVIGLPSPSNAAEYARALSREPHVAGTPAQARTRDYVIGRMRSWGLETEVRAYEVWMPHPTSVRV